MLKKKKKTQPQRSHPLPHCKQAAVCIQRLPETRPAACAGATEGKRAPHLGKVCPSLRLPWPLAAQENAPHPGRVCPSLWLPGPLAAEGKGAPRPGEHAQAFGCLNCWGGEDATRKCNRIRAVVEDPKTGTALSAGPAPYRTAGSLSSVEGTAAPLPPRSARELATWVRVHLHPPVSGRKLGTEETSKQKPNKQREPLQKGPVQQIKIPVGNTDYTRRGL